MNTKRVLLVEDDATCARLYQSLLERQGYAVTLLPDGSDAFMEAHNSEYDLLLLDLMLPNMDGLAMLRRLRAQKRFSRTPIFLYTSSDLSRVEPLALEAGVTRVFSKAQPAKEIVQAIQDTLAAMQATLTKTPLDPVEPDVRQTRDFRVPVPEATPKMTLRMADPLPEPPKPPPPPRPPVPEVEEEEPPSKPGLLSRLFKSRQRDS